MDPELKQSDFLLDDDEIFILTVEDQERVEKGNIHLSSATLSELLVSE